MFFYFFYYHYAQMQCLNQKVKSFIKCIDCMEQGLKASLAKHQMFQIRLWKVNKIAGIYGWLSWFTPYWQVTKKFWPKKKKTGYAVCVRGQL